MPTSEEAFRFMGQDLGLERDEETACALCDFVCSVCQRQWRCNTEGTEARRSQSGRQLQARSSQTHQTIEAIDLSSTVRSAFGLFSSRFGVHSFGK